MDIEVVEAIESLRSDIGRVETSLRAEIGKLRAEMVTKGDLTGELNGLRAELATKNDLAGGLSGLRSEMVRHMGIQTESLRDDIRILAEGFAMLSMKIDRIAPPLS